MKLTIGTLPALKSPNNIKCEEKKEVFFDVFLWQDFSNKSNIFAQVEHLTERHS
jgi:hypothetical protein